MKRHYLESTFDNEFILFGLSAAERPHRLAWLMNTQLHYGFERKDDMVLISKEKQESFFCRFDYLDEINRLQYYLLGNKDENLQLLPEIRNIDYVLMIKGALEYFRKKPFISAIRHLESIQLITEIDHYTLKSQHNLVIPD
ncbi:MAG: IPExxxVDY family protein [Bacteroidia bacterium]